MVRVQGAEETLRKESICFAKEKYYNYLWSEWQYEQYWILFHRENLFKNIILLDKIFFYIIHFFCKKCLLTLLMISSVIKHQPFFSQACKANTAIPLSNLCSYQNFFIFYHISEIINHIIIQYLWIAPA